MSVSLTSSGLVMPAASGTHQSGNANTFDDYEEGTYAPAITGTSGAGSGVSFHTRSGMYTIIGRMINVMIHINQSGWSSGPSGNIYVSLPSNVNSSYSCANPIGYMANWSKFPTGAICYANSDRMYLYTRDTASSSAPTLGTGITNIVAADMLATSEIYAGATYAR
tara:strand:+ start:214 stop:711 length:498 start_codon:yes stop_codon:yes gene_type:complete